MSQFDKYRKTAWPHQYRTALEISEIHGGVPTNEKVAEGWLRSKIEAKDDTIRGMVAEAMLARGVPEGSDGADAVETALATVDASQHLNGFKRFRCPNCPKTGPLCDDEHVLYIEGRQVKAAIKEAANCAISADKLKLKGWGKTNKQLHGFLAEHVVVLEDRISLGVMQPDGISQRFVHTFRGNAIQYEEFVTGVTVEFTVATDFEFAEKDWAMIWLTGEQQGIGASRSQGYGRYTITKWEKVG